MALTQVSSNGISDNSIVNADLHSAANIASTKLAKPIDLADNELIRLGTGSDLQIFHSGANSHVETSTSSAGDLYIVSQGSNHDLYLQASDDIFIRPASGENGIRVLGDSAVELYHNNNKKLETKSDGISVYGEVECSFLDLNGNADISGNLTVSGLSTIHGDLDMQDSDAVLMGTGDDFRLYHNGSNSFIENYTGGLYIDQQLDNADIILRTDNGNGSVTDYIRCDGGAGKVRLYNYGSQKLETTSSGIDVNGQAVCDSFLNTGITELDGSYVSFNDNGYIRGDVSGIFQLQAGTSNTFRFVNSSNSTTFAEVTSGSFSPGANNTFDLGTSSVRWRNLYTNDLNLSNEGSANDIDGTWGSFTIQEGEDDLFLINRRSGKKYKFNLTEVN